MSPAQSTTAQKTGEPEGPPVEQRRNTKAESVGLDRLIPLCDPFLHLLEQGIGRIVDGDRLDAITLDNAVHHVLAFGHFTENGVLSIEVRSGTMGDEELAAVGPGTGVGHRQNTRLVVT